MNICIPNYTSSVVLYPSAAVEERTESAFTMITELPQIAGGVAGVKQIMCYISFCFGTHELNGLKKSLNSWMSMKKNP